MNKSNYQHKDLADGKWFELSLMEQMANIGSEIFRAINWRQKNNIPYGRNAFERALELVDLTINDTKNKNRLIEITRLREALVDYFVYDNQFYSSDKIWQKYFYYFNYATRVRG